MGVEKGQKKEKTDDVLERKKEKERDRMLYVNMHLFACRNYGFIAGSYTTKHWQCTV